jgi:hypothetical protein
VTQFDIQAIQNFGQNMFDLVTCLTGDYDKALKMAEKAIYSNTGIRFHYKIRSVEGRPELFIFLQ